MKPIYRLEISWTTSRAQDTYGYNVCRLDCDGSRWKTCGGNYDMQGTVLANYFQDTHQDALQALVAKHELVDCGYSVPGYRKIPSLYGLTVNPDGNVTLDGGCGISAISDIIKACGFDKQESVNRKGHMTTIYLQERE